MKTQVILYIAISRDGFIADKDGGVGWLEPYSIDVPVELENNYPDFFNSIDCIVMGRKTYEQMLTFGDWPNAGKHTYVFTESTEPSSRADITFVSMDVKDFVQDIEKQHPGCKIWLEGGAHLVQQFYDAGLIDTYIITIIPTELHEGIALPKEIVNAGTLQKVDSKTFSNDIIQNTYINNAKSKSVKI